MRVHRLRISAFGPFAGTEEVDLDELARSGLFLLHGPTGAGKTSVLDAVCFALYGRVPGGRGTTRLRSDHAEGWAAPEVACEFSVGGRRFEVTRAPAWERPKKRGSGTTTQPARVVVRELRDGEWDVLTTRLDEAGQLLEDVLGLGLEQFTKLVLLPQGEFAAFLRADAEERRQLLERLFGTDRFAAVQAWVREQQQLVRREVETAWVATQRLLARAEQAAASLPEGAARPAGEAPSTDRSATDGTAADTTATDGTAADATAGDAGVVDSAGGDPVGAGAGTDPEAAVRALRARARHAGEEAVAGRGGTQAALRRATAARENAQALAERQREQAAAAAQRAALLAAALDQEHRREQARGALRAAGLVPLVDPLAAARARRDSAAAAVATAVQVLGARTAVPAGPDGAAEWLDQEWLEQEWLEQEWLERELHEARQAAAQLVAVEADAQALSRFDAEAGLRSAAVEAALHRLVASREAVAEVEAALLDARERRRRAARRAVAAPAAATEFEAARQVTAAVGDRDRLRAELAELDERREAARRTRDDLRERWLDLRQLRLEGMAAELARELSDGSPCPVCGSAVHPLPAEPAGQAVDDAAEQRARAAVDTAQELLDALDAELTSLRPRLAVAADTAAAADTASAAARLAAAQAAVDEVRQAVAAEQQAAVDEDAVAARLHEGVTRREAAEADLRAAEAERARAQERAGGLRARVDEARAGEPSVTHRRERLHHRAEALQALLDARHALAQAQELYAQTADTAETAALQAGFPDLPSAVGAVLAPEQLAAVERQVARYDEELAAVSARLQAPELLRAAAEPPAPLTAAVQQEELARADDEAAARALATAETALSALEAIAADLEGHLRACAPMLEHHVTLVELARCLDGTGGDNALRMSLSAYVLAARLEQVAHAASLRLSAMSSGRYTLVHSDQAQRGRGRSGLALRVVDGWTGLERDTASLSGGESFYTSLALALGLADVVTAEAGGSSVETLFVDEGFGSLDEEALEEVLDVLDGLRSGGRAVGLVSHVADLRERIPARLEVVKTRHGSRLVQAGA